MIELKNIIERLAPKTVIGARNRLIKEPIQLSTTNARQDVIMWASSKYYASLAQVRYGTIICEKINQEDISPDCIYLLVDQPRQKFSELLAAFFTPVQKKGIHSSAFIDASVKIGATPFIGANVVLEENVVIGDNCVIEHNTVIKRGTIIGNNVLIGSNCVLGGVGFGYEKDEEGNYHHLAHIGNLVLKDNVEIGNCTAIDRAVMGSTLIGENVKIDNLVHIAHGVQIGKNSLVIGKSQIAGSVKVGENCWIAPSSTIINKAKIGDNAVVGLGAVVIRDVAAGTTVMGNPARQFVKR